VRRDSGLILRVTRIESRVVSGHGLNREHIDPLPDTREGYVVETIDGGVIQQPGDIHGQVATQNGALHGGGFSVVQGLLPEIKGRYLGGNLGGRNKRPSG